MAGLSWKVREYLENNGKVYETERDASNFSLVNLSDGNGDIIENWNVFGVSRPTDSQLDALDSAATDKYNLYKIKRTRKRSYGNWKNQLDQLYHDIDDGKLGVDAKTGSWYLSVKAIKDANPKT